MDFFKVTEKDKENAERLRIEAEEYLRDKPKKLIFWKRKIHNYDISTFASYDENGYLKEISYKPWDNHHLPVFFIEEIEKLLQKGYRLSDDALTQRSYNFFKSEVDKLKELKETVVPIREQIEALKKQEADINKSFSRDYEKRKLDFYKSFEGEADKILCPIVGYIKKTECSNKCSFYTANGCKK